VWGELKWELELELDEVRYGGFGFGFEIG